MVSTDAIVNGTVPEPANAAATTVALGEDVAPDTLPIFEGAASSAPVDDAATDKEIKDSIETGVEAAMVPAPVAPTTRVLTTSSHVVVAVHYATAAASSFESLLDDLRRALVAAKLDGEISASSRPVVFVFVGPNNANAETSFGVVPYPSSLRLLDNACSEVCRGLQQMGVQIAGVIFVHATPWVRCAVHFLLGHHRAIDESAVHFCDRGVDSLPAGFDALRDALADDWLGFDPHSWLRAHPRRGASELHLNTTANGTLSVHLHRTEQDDNTAIAVVRCDSPPIDWSQAWGELQTALEQASHESGSLILVIHDGPTMIRSASAQLALRVPSSILATVQHIWLLSEAPVQPSAYLSLLTATALPPSFKTRFSLTASRADLESLYGDMEDVLGPVPTWKAPIEQGKPASTSVPASTLSSEQPAATVELESSSSSVLNRTARVAHVADVTKQKGIQQQASVGHGNVDPAAEVGSSLALVQSFLLDRVGESLAQENDEQSAESPNKESATLASLAHALEDLSQEHQQTQNKIEARAEDESATQSDELSRLEGIDKAYREAVVGARARYAAALRAGAE